MQTFGFAGSRLERYTYTSKYYYYNFPNVVSHLLISKYVDELLLLRLTLCSTTGILLCLNHKEVIFATSF